MPLGMEIGLGSGDFVFDGSQLPQKKGHTHLHPIFGACLLWPRSPISATAELLFIVLYRLSYTYFPSVK